MDQTIPIKPLLHWNNNTVASTVLDSVSIIMDDDTNTGMTTQSQPSIKEAKYEKIDTDEVAHSQKHVTLQQQSTLAL